MSKQLITVTLVVIATAALACASSGAAADPAATTATRVDPDLITRPEIDVLNARAASEIVQRLRPNWITRGTATTVNMGGTKMGGTGGPRGGLVVYIDDAKTGWVESLRDIPATLVSSIQHLDAATATAVLPGLGSDIITGAIVVHQHGGK